MKKRDATLLGLATIDASLKAVAWVFLRHLSQPSTGSSLIRLGYVENGSGFGFDQTRLLGRYGVATDDAFVVCTLAVFLVLALVTFLWHRIEARAWIKTAAAVVVYFAAAVVALSLHDAMNLSLSPYFRGILRALGPMAVALVLYGTVATPYSAAMSLLLLAGTVGNCASLILPPFAVIDYFGIYRPSIHAYIYANAADAYLFAAMLLIALFPAYSFAQWLEIRRKRSRAR
jgi:lipoprotein signal peptidase